MGSAFTFGDVADPTPGVTRLQARVAATLVILVWTNEAPYLYFVGYAMTVTESKLPLWQYG